MISEADSRGARGVGEREKVYFYDFVKVLSHFRPINKNKPHLWNTREAKLRFAFTMYDLNKSETITKDEFKNILQMMIGSNVSEEQVNSIADRTMREADKDNDGYITFQEFCHAMEKTDIEQKMTVPIMEIVRQRKGKCLESKERPKIAFGMKADNQITIASTERTCTSCKI
ncbi:pbo-1 [Pristionchus pacificus]|uniref:Pbo-1 n=1 Tax=Pristionchus pacificus TaxID=54126 RepID=A0A2A6BQS6_PRIPA|nr:pbo-1 [Pristionchus pacificus]|eukprot:PDM68218.1 pbo-1 [Pristionchus pacificus]